MTFAARQTLSSQWWSWRLMEQMFWRFQRQYIFHIHIPHIRMLKHRVSYSRIAKSCMTSILQTYDTWYRLMLNEGPDRCPPRHSSSSHPDFVGQNNGYVWCEQQTLPKRVEKNKGNEEKHGVQWWSKESPVMNICCEPIRRFSGWRAVCRNGYWKTSTSSAGKWFPSWDFMEAMAGWAITWSSCMLI